LPARGEGALPVAASGVRAALGIAEGGRFCDSSRCRGDTAELFGEFVGRPFIAGAFGEFVGRPFITGELCAGAFGVGMR